MRKRGLDSAQAKAKRQKKMAIGGGVLLMAVLAFQLPGMLKGSKQAAPEAAPAPTTPVQPGPTETTGGSAVAPVNENASKLPAEPDPAPAPLEGQLVTFNLFKSKDPFVQQLAESPGGETSDSPPASTPPTVAPPSATPPPSAPPVSEPPASEPPVSEPPVSEPPVAEPPVTEPPPTSETAPSAATISVNGLSEEVKIGGAFPKANPLFRLASIKDGIAQIGIAGGSLQDGSETVPVSKDKPLTLMNTADGTRYVIKLLAVI